MYRHKTANKGNRESCNTQISSGVGSKKTGIPNRSRPGQNFAHYSGAQRSTNFSPTLENVVMKAASGLKQHQQHPS